MPAESWIMQIDESSPLIATATHDGHDVSPEYSRLTGLTDSERLMEEDPFTGGMAHMFASHIVARKSRFQVDLNRERTRAVYLKPEDAWGLKVWKADPPPEHLINDWLGEHDSFYDQMTEVIGNMLNAHPYLFVLDLHSYRHRWDPFNREVEEPQELNPDINLGMSNIAEKHGDLFEPIAGVLERVLGCVEMPGRGMLDVRRDVRFKGANFCRWVNATFPGRVLCIAMEIKKIFMDEWTGELHEERYKALLDGLLKARQPLERALKSL